MDGFLVVKWHSCTHFLIVLGSRNYNVRLNQKKDINFLIFNGKNHTLPGRLEPKTSGLAVDNLNVRIGSVLWMCHFYKLINPDVSLLKPYLNLLMKMFQYRQKFESDTFFLQTSTMLGSNLY
jgi:hypothetical protein